MTARDSCLLAGLLVLGLVGLHLIVLGLAAAR